MDLIMPKYCPIYNINMIAWCQHYAASSCKYLRMVSDPNDSRTWAMHECVVVQLSTLVYVGFKSAFRTAAGRAMWSVSGELRTGSSKRQAVGRATDRWFPKKLGGCSVLAVSVDSGGWHAYVQSFGSLCRHRSLVYLSYWRLLACVSVYKC